MGAYRLHSLNTQSCNRRPPQKVVLNWSKSFFQYWPGCTNSQKKKKSCTTKSSLMHDWVFRLEGPVYCLPPGSNFQTLLLLKKCKVMLSTFHTIQVQKNQSILFFLQLSAIFGNCAFKHHKKPK